MKTFGLFEPGATEPTEAFKGVLTILAGTTVTVYGEPEEGKEGRRIVMAIPLLSGQTVKEVK